MGTIVTDLGNEFVAFIFIAVACFGIINDIFIKKIAITKFTSLIVSFRVLSQLMLAIVVLKYHEDIDFILCMLLCTGMIFTFTNKLYNEKVLSYRALITKIRELWVWKVQCVLFLMALFISMGVMISQLLLV